MDDEFHCYYFGDTIAHILDTTIYAENNRCGAATTQVDGRRAHKSGRVNFRGKFSNASSLDLPLKLFYTT